MMKSTSRLSVTVYTFTTLPEQRYILQYAAINSYSNIGFYMSRMASCQCVHPDPTTVYTFSTLHEKHNKPELGTTNNCSNKGLTNSRMARCQCCMSIAKLSDIPLNLLHERRVSVHPESLLRCIHSQNFMNNVTYLNQQQPAFDQIQV